MQSPQSNNRVSPSQVNTWDTCKRRWWYSRRRPRTSNVYAEFGTRVHALLESWLALGIAPPLRSPAGPDKHGLCAVQGLGLIPAPRTAIVEQGFKLDYQGVRWNGRIDFLHDYRAQGPITIGDHKTISKLARAKTSDELLVDPQRIVYAAWAAATFSVRSVTATWVYYQRTSPKSRRVDVTESSTEIWQRFRDLHHRVGLPILAATSIETPHAFPRNLDACQLYPPHGCPYAGECLQGVSALDLAGQALARASASVYTP